MATNLNHCSLLSGARGRNRTTDTRIFKTPFGRRLNGMGIVEDEGLSKRIVFRRGSCLNEVGKTCFKGPEGRAELEDLDCKDRLRVV
ncbi:hypothetical protein NHN26_11540 [Rhodovulum tesquicola]|uniref:hypothetical protein n=1 Tax=Rhodovulum tesquicola TaxID=540254 RepID=UPI002096F9A8|nr:hypothetical protein [Rhodovulum tesquicola]MCO8145859.1 hypothetical protein [Rhodovulum tesquicola]